MNQQLKKTAELIIKEKKTSAIFLVSSLKISYQEALDTLVELENLGILGPHNESRDRDIIIKDLDEIQLIFGKEEVIAGDELKDKNKISVVNDFKFCQFCGLKQKQENRICESCKKNLVEDELSIKTNNIKIPKKKKRPFIISLIAILSFIGVVYVIPLIFNQAKYVADWYPAYLGFSTIVSLSCMIGVWYMKKWAAYTYAVLVTVNQIVLLASDLWDFGSLLVPAVITGVFLYHSKNMD